MLLGDMGADVIKVEPPGTGDLSRRMGGERLRMKGADHAPFMALNRNKRSVVLDLKTAAGRDAFMAIARTADVMVENFRPGVAERLGIGYDAVSRENPRIVYAGISGFGASGPWADRPGFDLIAQGMSGVMSVTGVPDGVPVKCGVPVADMAAGLFAVAGIQAALLARGRTGRGQRVDTSLFEAALSFSVWEATEYFATGEAPRARGSAHRLSAPYQAFRTSDGYINIAALTQQQWSGLCAALDVGSLENDARFANNSQRLANLPDLVEALESTLATRTTTEWVERLLAAGVPAGPILDYPEVFGSEHARARGMIEYVDHPMEGELRTMGFPLKFAATPARVRRPPPALGEHTREVLAEAGIRDGDKT
jgi:formyl-CoA transferase